MCFDCLTDATNAFVNRQILHSGTLPGAPPPVSCCLSQVMSAVPDQAVAVEIDDDRKLEELGYVPSFKREFSNLATVRYRFSRAFPHLRLTKPVHRSALRSASWYFLQPEPKNSAAHQVVCQGVCSSVSTTFNTPLLLGGPSSVCPDTLWP
jgi:hypothetical protein